jgi:hypothetical protein
MITDPSLQPCRQIRSLLGEADNASIETIQIPTYADFTGYTEDPVDVNIDAPPALGDDYVTAQATALTRPSTRVLRIRVIGGGEGYITSPKVTVSPPTGEVRVQCEATCTINRFGSVDSIFVINPGQGYGGRGSTPAPPIVKVAAPNKVCSDVYCNVFEATCCIALIDKFFPFFKSCPPLIVWEKY